MNRLQVGDECYVRADGNVIYKALIFDYIYGNTIVKLVNFPERFLKLNFYNLVYPFPCVKKLAQ